MLTSLSRVGLEIYAACRPGRDAGSYIRASPLAYRYPDSDRLLVKCVRMELKTVPALPRNTTELRLNKNHIRHLDEMSFPHMPKLESLDLGGNPLEGIGRNAFRMLPHLQKLNIYVHKWGSSNQFSLGQITSLTELTLDCGQMFTPQIQMKVFEDANVRSIDVKSQCRLILDNHLFIRNDRLSDVTSLGMKPKYVNMSNIDVHLRIDKDMNSTEDCLSFEGVVIASKLSIRCKRVRNLDITMESFKLAENVTQLQVNIKGLILWIVCFVCYFIPSGSHTHKPNLGVLECL